MDKTCGNCKWGGGEIPGKWRVCYFPLPTSGGIFDLHTHQDDSPCGQWEDRRPPEPRRMCVNCKHARKEACSDKLRCVENRSPVEEHTLVTATNFFCCYWEARQDPTEYRPGNGPAYATLDAATYIWSIFIGPREINGTVSEMLARGFVDDEDH